MGHGGLEWRGGDEGGELLGFDDAVEKRGLRNGPAGLPPSAVEGFGGRGNRDRARGHPWQGSDADVFGAEGEVFVDLVSQHEEVLLRAEFGELGECPTGKDRAGRVVRGIDDDHGGLVRHGRAYRIDVDIPAVAGFLQGDGDAGGVGKRDGSGVGIVVGLKDNDLVAGLHEAQHRGGDGFGSARGDHDVVLRDGVGFGDGAEQLRNAAQGSVLVVTAGDVFLGNLQHALRAIAIRKTLSQVHRVILHGKRGHGGEDGLAEFFKPVNSHLEHQQIVFRSFHIG